jgi:hypothetical protein
MGINKVIYNGQVLIDLTSATVTPETLVEGTIAFNSAGEQIIGTLVISGGYTNQVPISINADGTIYNVIGYKTGYRVRSGGAEGVQASAICTGFIPFKLGDTLRIKPALGTIYNTTACINFSDGSFTNLGQSNQNGSAGVQYGICSGNTQYFVPTIIDGVSVLTLDPAAPSASKIKYIRITHDDAECTRGENIIVTVNEEIK